MVMHIRTATLLAVSMILILKWPRKHPVSSMVEHYEHYYRDNYSNILNH